MERHGRRGSKMDRRREKQDGETSTAAKKDGETSATAICFYRVKIGLWRGEEKRSRGQEEEQRKRNKNKKNEQ